MKKICAAILCLALGFFLACCSLNMDGVKDASSGAQASSKAPASSKLAGASSVPTTADVAPNPSGNSANGGYMCETPDAIYWVNVGSHYKTNASSGDAVNFQIHTETRNRTNQKPFSQEHPYIACLTYDDQNLYFCTSDNFGYSDNNVLIGIYSISFATGKETAIYTAKPTFPNSEPILNIQNLTAYKGKLYFVTRTAADEDTVLCSINTDGSGIHEFDIPGLQPIQFAFGDERIYFAAYDGAPNSTGERPSAIYKTDASFSALSKMIGTDDFGYPNCLQTEGDNVFYCAYIGNGYEIHRIDGAGRKTVMWALHNIEGNAGEGWSFCINVTGGVVYFTSIYPTNGGYDAGYAACNYITGEKKEHISEIDLKAYGTSGLYFVGGHLFYGYGPEP